MLYTLALSNVNTRLVFRSRPLSASKISGEGLVAKCASRSDNCEFGYVSDAPSRVIDVVVERRGLTLFMFPRRRAYSFRTSCSSGERSEARWESWRRVDWLADMLCIWDLVICQLNICKFGFGCSVLTGANRFRCLLALVHPMHAKTSMKYVLVRPLCQRIFCG